MKKAVLVRLDKTDWKQLRYQKSYLMDIEEHLGSGYIPNVTWLKALDSIINWIDDIQDQAAEQISETRVFGRLK